MDFQWGNENFLLIMDENNIIHCITDPKALKDYGNLLILILIQIFKFLIVEMHMLYIFIKTLLF